MAVFWPVIVPPVHFVAFFHSGKDAIGYADDSTLMADVPSQALEPQ